MTQGLPPRELALRAMRDWQRGKHFADEILERIAGRYTSQQDRAWIREIFFGVARRLSAVDFVIDRLRSGEIDNDTRAVLRLGIYELLHMRTPEHAAVHETVNLGGRAGGLVNAILRRFLRERQQIEAALAAAPDHIRYSHPAFLIERWTAQFGREAAIALCEQNNHPSELFVRANGLRIGAAELAATVDGAEVTPFHPRSLRAPFLPLEWLKEGLCYVQDPSTLVSCDLLDPQPGEQILDACAAPGGKTTYLAELMGNRGHIVASDLWPSRLEFLARNIRRLGIRNTHPIAADLMKTNRELKPASFDRILLDAPCSNTGVIRRRVDVRWRLTEEDFIRMPEQQFALLRRVVELLRPGGILVYSTCSLEEEENEKVVARAVAELPLECVHQCRVSPWLDHVDGAFAARLVKK